MDIALISLFLSSYRPAGYARRREIYNLQIGSQKNKIEKMQ